MSSSERRWECPSSSGGKFWCVKIEGSIVTTSWGKLNTKGQTKSTDHTDSEKAKKFVETTIKKKEKEGYIEKISDISGEVPEDEGSIEESDEVVEPVPTSYTLPPLYNTDAKGKERVWKVWVVGNKVGKMHGEVDGKQTTAFRTYEGKNTGRSNETSAEEQANREAERDWVKQTDKGYKPKSKEGKSLYKKVQEEKVRQGGVNTNVASILAYELRDVVIEPKEPSKTAKAKKIAKAKKKLNNGAMPGYKCDLFPMGCQKWAADPKNAERPEAKVLKYFNFKRGVYIQKKLDGIRCLVRLVTDDDGKQWVILMSRQGNQFVHLKSLREEVANFLKGHEDIILDCEVYAEKLYGTFVYKKSSKKDKIVFSPPDEDDPQLLPKHLNFKAITSTVRSTMTDAGPLEDQMCLYVFDIVDPTEEMDQDERFTILDELFARKGIAKRCPRVKRVECKVIHSVKEITKYHDKVAEEGYEGVVLRDRALKYECLKKNKKSKWMRKYKYFFDYEREILGVKRDKGVDREQFTWICQTDEGVKFYPKPEGTREMKWEWYDNKDEYIGKMLTVRYQGLEDSGKPRFPIGIAIRDYE